MRAALSIAALVIALSMTSQVRTPCNLYSQTAVDIHATKQPIRSPSGKATVAAKVVEAPRDPNGMQVLYTVSLGEKSFTMRLSGWGAEVSWSPDSSAFAVTQTEGGGGIGYRVYLFCVEPQGLRKVDVSKVVEQAVGPSPNCEIKIYPNTAVVAWLNPSRLLVAAETVPVSICKCAGAFSVYEVSVPDLQVVAHYSQSDTKQKYWNVLGCELRNASDRCSP